VLALTALSEDHAKAVQKALSGTKEKAKLRDFKDNGTEELREYVQNLVDAIGNGFTL